MLSLKWLSVLVLGASLTACKSELAQKIPPPSAIDKCAFGYDKPAGRFYFACTPWYVEGRQGYYVSPDEAAKDKMLCMSMDHVALAEQYEEKVARRIAWLEKKCGSACK